MKRPTRVNNDYNKHPNNLKKWFPELLRLNYLTIQEFCTASGICRTLYYQYVRDTNRPSLATLKKMCDVLNVSLKEGLEQVLVKKLYYGKHVWEL